jgi:hypothetical protein
MPLIASRAADSAFALGFGKASTFAGYSTWLTNVAVSSSYSFANTCTDSSGNTYLTIDDGTWLYVQKISTNGTIIWQKQVGTSSYVLYYAHITLKNDDSTLYIAYLSNKYNSSNLCLEITSLNTLTGNIVSSGRAYYYSSRTFQLQSFRYSSYATNGKNLVVTLYGTIDATYSTVYSSVVMTIDPSNFASYTISRVFLPTASNGITAYGATIINGGYSVVRCFHSSYGPAVQSVNNAGSPYASQKSLGSESGWGIDGDSSGNFYTDFYTANGKIGIQKNSTEACTFVWAKELTITGATATILSFGSNTVYVDSTGNVYCVATLKNGATNAYLVVFKMDSSGNVQWIKKFYTSYSQSTQGGPLFAGSITGKESYLSVGAAFNNSSYFSTLITLNTNGAVLDTTYTGTSDVGNLTVSTPAYTVASVSSAGSWTGEGSDTPPTFTTASVANITSTTSSLTNVVVPLLTS